MSQLTFAPPSSSACLDHVNTVLEEEFGRVSILSQLAAVVTDDCCVTFGVTLVHSRGILVPICYSNLLNLVHKNPTWKSLGKSWDFVTFGVFVLRHSWRTSPSSCHAFGPAHRHHTTRASWVEATALLTSGKRPSQLLSNALFVSLHGSGSCNSARLLWHPPTQLDANHWAFQDRRAAICERQPMLKSRQKCFQQFLG